ncbi:unnamed protein product [Paramecium sonneborni]|uniref:Uncharacterized protein n=1 Tax=Paramecium sonneborni TaxID=65129 RepID=A0A8S1PE39_9CILI|nr:unnamed protein product [Paramecium sonneborni]
METALNQRTHNILISIKENIQIKFEERIKEILSIITDIPFHFNTFFVKPIKIEQIEKCQSICFNNNDSLIATTVGKSIQIWNFQKGEIQQKGLPLVGHKSDVTTILFSRNQVESFISGGDLGENSIIMWSLQNNTWIQTVPIIQEIGGFRSMILNKKDNKLFTADSQGYIKLWKVDFINKLIEKEYEFPKPFGQVWEISLNDSETSLISCVEDHKIILWKKQSEKNWFIKQEIRLKSQPLRIKFLNDNYFICCTEHDGYLKEFKLKKELFVEKILNKIKLDQQNQDMPSFPIQQNRNIIFVKHNKFIHFLRKNEQGLIQRYQKISFQDMYISGALSNKKQILMIWSNGQYYLFKVGV